MTGITVDDQQARIICEATSAVPIFNRQGMLLGHVSRESAARGSTFTAAEIEAAQRRVGSDGPWYTTQQVLEHLRSLAPE